MDNTKVTIIDDEKFYLDHIKYTVTKEHLVVSGYNKVGFRGTANIVSSIIYKGSLYKVLEIRDDAFADCSKLIKVTIPESVTSIGTGAFYGCSSLTFITIPNSVISIGADAFGGCSKLTKVTIPESVTCISAGAFAYCYSLTSVTIPNNVKSIGEGAFCDCHSLTSVTIPNSVKSIGDFAFFRCARLTSVYSWIEKPFDLPPSNFEGSAHFANDATLYVPRGTTSAYESAKWADRFSRVVEM